MIWVTKISEAPIHEVDPYLSIDSSNQSNNSLYTQMKGIALPINEIVSRTDIPHIQLSEVPKSYFTTIKKRIGKHMEFYSNLLQITVRGNGMIFDLDSYPISEVLTMEAID